MDSNHPISPTPAAGPRGAVGQPRRQSLPYLAALITAVVGAVMSCGDASGSSAEVFFIALNADGSAFDAQVGGPMPAAAAVP